MKRRSGTGPWHQLATLLSEEGIWKSIDHLIAVGGLMAVICAAHIYFLIVGTFQQGLSAYYLYLTVAAIFFGMFSLGTFLRVLILVRRKKASKRRKEEKTNDYTRRLERNLYDE